MGKKVRIRIRDEQPVSYFLELRDLFLVKILKSFDVDPGSGIPDGKNSDPGWKRVGSGIRYKHPGSATLVPSVKKYDQRYESIYAREFYLLVRPSPCARITVGKSTTLYSLDWQSHP
jgi:hypothetical protein